MGQIHFPKPDGSSETWTWKAGTTFTAIRDPNKKKFVVSHPDMTGCTWEDIYRGRRKKYQAGEVTPGLVKKYIAQNLRKKAVATR